MKASASPPPAYCNVKPRKLWSQADLLADDDDARGPMVLAVQASAVHKFSKKAQPSIRLLEGLGVEGDAHAGATVQHLYNKSRDPSKPNLRQVHLLHAELFDELRDKGFAVRPGELGENITTRGVDLLALPTGTLLHLGPEAVVKVTGLRNPCVYIERFQKGLLAAVKDHSPEGKLIRKTGVMSIVLHGGTVRAGDSFGVVLPTGTHRALKPV